MNVKLDCKELSDIRRQTLKEEIDKLITKPRLSIIHIGDDFASNIYIRNKQKACEQVGIICDTIIFQENVKESEVAEKILELNKNPSIHGIMLQLPIPKHLDEKYLLNLIEYHKDVDGLTVENIGRLVSRNMWCLQPCTALGIIHILENFDIDIAGKSVCVINRSNIVGKPLASMLTARDATVTVCHSKTKNLEFYTKNADIIITAVGKRNFINRNMLKKGSVIIDVSINRDENNKVVGDLDMESIKDFDCSYTPVPGGVGPMTVTTLLENTYKAYCYYNS